MTDAHYLSELRSSNPLSDRAAAAGALLLPLLGFLTPISGPAATAVAILIALAAAVRRQFRDHFRPLLANPIVISILIFIALHGISLLWTEDPRAGLRIVNKQWRLLLIPVFMTFVRKDHLQFYIDAFIAGMTVTHLASYLYLAHVIPFEIMDRISYNPLLALCIYLLGHTLLFTAAPAWKKLLYGLLVLSMTLNMFLTQGRTGYLALFVMLLLLSLQYFERNRLKASSVSVTLILAVFMLSYHYSAVFQQRIDAAVDEIRLFEMNRLSPDGNDRITFYLNTLVIIREHPLLGVGTGDFADEYRKVNRLRSPNVYDTDDPHNAYLFAMAQFGVPGLAALLAIFFFQLKASLKPVGSLRHLRLALPLFFIVISLFGTYLTGHFTALTLAYFTAVFYRESDADS